jgi:hypothetical protein
MGHKSWVIFDDLTEVDLVIQSNGKLALKLKDTDRSRSVALEVPFEDLHQDHGVWNTVVEGVRLAGQRGVRVSDDASMFLIPEP